MWETVLTAFNIFLLAPVWLLASAVWLWKSRWPLGRRVSTQLLAVAWAVALFASTFMLHFRTCEALNHALGVGIGGHLPLHCLTTSATLTPLPALGSWIAFVIATLGIQRRSAPDDERVSSL